LAVITVPGWTFCTQESTPGHLEFPSSAGLSRRRWSHDAVSAAFKMYFPRNIHPCQSWCLGILHLGSVSS
jgi:hypothetical protein